MKSLLWIVSFVLGCTGIAYTQDIDIRSSEELINQSNTTFFEEILGYNENGWYVLRKGGPISNEEILVEHYSNSFKLIHTARIANSEGVLNDGKLHRKTRMDNGAVYHFYQGWNKHEGKSSFILYLADGHGAATGEPILLSGIPAPGQINAGTFHHYFSPDGSKLLVVTEHPFNKGAKEKLDIQVFSTSGFGLLWSKSIEFDFESKRNPSNLAAINDLGVVTVFKEHDYGKKARAYQWLNISDKHYATEALDFKNSYPTSSKIIVDKNNEFFLAGTAAETGKNRSAWQRSFHLRATNQGALMHFTNSLVSPEVIRLAESERAAKITGYALSDYVLKNVFVTSNRHTILVLEQHTKSKTSAGQAQPPVYNHTIHHNQVVILGINETGEQIWSSVLDKKQTETTQDPEITYGSFAGIMKDDKVHIIWNYTNLDRETGTGKRYWHDRNGSRIYVNDVFGKEAFYPAFLTTIDEKGGFVYSDRTFSALPLVDIQKMNAYNMAVDPKFYFQTENGLVVLSRMDGRAAKRYKFSAITF